MEPELKTDAVSELDRVRKLHRDSIYARVKEQHEHTRALAGLQREKQRLQELVESLTAENTRLREQLDMASRPTTLEEIHLCAEEGN